jgi:uncharacterized protein YkwD
LLQDRVEYAMRRCSVVTVTGPALDGTVAMWAPTFRRRNSPPRPRLYVQHREGGIGMSRFASRLGPVAVGILVAAGLTLSSTPVQAMPLPNTVSTTTAAAFRSPVAQEVALINADRKAAGLPALVETAALDRIANDRAQDMVTNGYFGHYRPGHTTFAVLELLRAYRVPFIWYGENIMRGSGPPESVAGPFNTWWMNDAPHRANLLSTHYRHIGIGVVVSGSTVTMVADFTD